MSTYHLHARLFVGALDNPKRNELQSAESDDREHVTRLAEELAARGFRVWVYKHHHQPNGNHGPYRVVAELAARERP